MKKIKNIIISFIKNNNDVKDETIKTVIILCKYIGCFYKKNKRNLPNMKDEIKDATWIVLAVEKFTFKIIVMNKKI